MSDLPPPGDAPMPADQLPPPPSASEPTPVASGKRSSGPVVFALLAGLAIGFGLGAAIFRSNETTGEAQRVPIVTVGSTPVVDRPTTPPTPAAPTTRKVVYKTGGTAPYGDITYKTPTGIGQQQDVDIPLKLKSGELGITFTMDPGDFVSISVQNGTDTGSVSCTIEVDGRVVASNTSSGAYAIASCDGTV